MKLSISSMFAAALLVAAPAAPAVAQQAPAAVKVGMQVVDVSGAIVGTISGRKDDSITLKTDRHDIPLPTSSFTVQDGKAYFGMTRTQVNAEYEKMLAEAEASLVPGAIVNGLGGKRLGTIEAIDDEIVTLKLDSGQSVQLPRSGVAGRPDGAVVGITAEQLAEKIAGS